jgi:hypothetical protein
MDHIVSSFSMVIALWKAFNVDTFTLFSPPLIGSHKTACHYSPTNWETQTHYYPHLPTKAGIKFHPRDRAAVWRCWFIASFLKIECSFYLT